MPVGGAFCKAESSTGCDSGRFNRQATVFELKEILKLQWRTGLWGQFHSLIGCYGARRLSKDITRIGALVGVAAAADITDFTPGFPKSMYNYN